MTKLSVATISFNQAAFLERTIQSVLGQEGMEIEYIVLDPGSTDGSRDIIGRYRAQISIVDYSPDAGPADGLNKGLARATGEFFCYVNSDDVLLPGAVEAFSRALRNHPDTDVIYGNGLFIDEADRVLRPAVSAQYFNAWLYVHGLATIVQQASFIRTSSLRRAGGFNLANKTCWDGEAFLKIALDGGRFRRVWGDWGGFRIHGGSITGTGRLKALFEADIERMFRETQGRDRTAADRAVAAAAKALLRLWDWRRLGADLAARRLS